jgi:hypothetical protein
MDAIGRLGRVFFTALYDLRVPVGLVSIVAFVALLVIAWRRGWFGVARRHPRASVVAVLAAVALGSPVTWYLASPIWIRSSLVEPVPTSPPAVVASALPAPSVGQAAPTAPPPSTEPTESAVPPPSIEPASPVAPPFAPTTLAAGRFAGTDEFHFGRGTASIVEIAPGRYHLRLDDFSVRNGPDLYVYLSTAADGYADDALEIGRLKATDGAFGYDLPKGTDPSVFRSAIIWCKQFSHLFAVAPFRT